MGILFRKWDGIIVSKVLNKKQIVVHYELIFAKDRGIEITISTPIPKATCDSIELNLCKISFFKTCLIQSLGGKCLISCIMVLVSSSLIFFSFSF